jgi:hypothetical protein
MYYKYKADPQTIEGHAGRRVVVRGFWGRIHIRMVIFFPVFNSFLG